jgi:thiaminase
MVSKEIIKEAAKLAAFARSLTPSGAVVEERPFPTDLHKVAREWTNKWCQTYSPHDQQAVAIALWELLEKQASNFASPSVEPTVSVDEQDWRKIMEVFESSSGSWR